MSHFYLTLPSNSSEKFYPGNTLTNYTTRLHNSVTLNDDWEVGLSEIMFPRSWYNIQKGGVEYYTVSCDRCHMEDKSSGDKSSVYELKISVPGGYYESMESIIKELNHSALKPYRVPAEGGHLEDTIILDRKTHETVIPKFKYNDVNKRVYITLQPDMTLTFSDKLAEILGLNKKQNPAKNPSQTDTSVVRGSRASDIDGGLHAMYVYCDVLEGVPVGDTSAPLLRIVDVEGMQGKMIHRLYENPRYVPLQKRCFDSIEIFISDDLGKNIPFENGKVIVTLHFRRAVQPYFLG